MSNALEPSHCPIVWLEDAITSARLASYKIASSTLEGSRGLLTLGPGGRSLFDGPGEQNCRTAMVWVDGACFVTFVSTFFVSNGYLSL